MRLSIPVADVLAVIRPLAVYALAGDPFETANITWADPIKTLPTDDEFTAGELTTVKAKAVAAVRAQTSASIYARWPAYVQANAALGIYDSLPTTDTRFPANVKAGIIAASAACDAAVAAINAMTDVPSVQAYTAVIP
jgi:hypothetical protein